MRDLSPEQYDLLRYVDDPNDDRSMTNGEADMCLVLKMQGRLALIPCPNCGRHDAYVVTAAGRMAMKIFDVLRTSSLSS
jgi:hypothetical protein